MLNMVELVEDSVFLLGGQSFAGLPLPYVLVCGALPEHGHLYSVVHVILGYSVIPACNILKTVHLLRGRSMIDFQ